MIFEQIVSKGLASNSYFIANEKEAVVIDPRRDIDEYLHLAKKNNVRIKAIFDTHRNEDFINGSLELSTATGAKIYHGQDLSFGYGNPTKEGEKFNFGNLEYEIFQTPGHTLESISIVVREAKKTTPLMVFTGDTLFVGDVGRIDFYRDSKKQAQAAQWLYDSIFNKILKLPDGVIVAPAHGAGSICGGAISSLPFSTIGYEKENNVQLQLTKEEFLAVKSQEQFEIAPNMSYLEKYNQEGPLILGSLPTPSALTTKEVKEHIAQGAQIIDIREPESFAGGHISKSLNIWQNGLPTFALWFLNYQDPIIIIKDIHQEIEPSVRYLIRLGFDNIIGYLQGFREWVSAGEHFMKSTIWSIHDFKSQKDKKDIFILDVRTAHDLHDKGKLKDSHHIFLGELPEKMIELPKEKKICIHCDSGFRANVALSILEKNGFENVTSIFGNFSSLKE